MNQGCRPVVGEFTAEEVLDPLRLVLPAVLVVGTDVQMLPHQIVGGAMQAVTPGLVTVVA